MSGEEKVKIRGIGKKRKKVTRIVEPFRRSTKLSEHEDYKLDFDYDSLTEEEQKKMVELLEMTRKWELYELFELVRDYCENRINLYRYLRGWNFDIQKASKSLFSCIKWRVKKAPQEIHKNPLFHDTMRKYPSWYNFDCASSYGFDKEGHPIAYVFLAQEKRIRPRGKIRVGWARDVAIFMLEDAIRQMKKGMYKVTIVIDAKGLSLLTHTRMVPRFLKKFSGFSEYYCDVLSRILIVNAGTLIRTLWRLATPFLYPETAEKVQFCKDNSILKKYIDEDQILKRLGGNSDFKYNLKEHMKQVCVELEGNGDVDVIVDEQRKILVERRNGNDIRMFQSGSSTSEESGEEDEDSEQLGETGNETEEDDVISPVEEGEEKKFEEVEGED